MSLMQLKPHHFAILVSDIEQSIKWYNEILGFRLKKRFERKDVGGQFAFLELNGIEIEIYSVVNSIRQEEYNPSIDSLSTQGMKHFAFSVKDIVLAVQDLKSRGVKFIKEPTLGSSRQMYAIFLDNSGIMLEVIEEAKCQVQA